MIGTPTATRPARGERTQVQAQDERGSTRSRVDTSPTRRAISPRRSLAAIRAGESRRNERSIAVALLSNLVVAAAKLAAGLATGSAALLAEAAHSAADSVNEGFLVVSLRHGRRPADAEHPPG
jgi:Co/Zn/Cd efflux system component